MSYCVSAPEVRATEPERLLDAWPDAWDAPRPPGLYGVGTERERASAELGRPVYRSAGSPSSWVVHERYPAADTVPVVLVGLARATPILTEFSDCILP